MTSASGPACSTTASCAWCSQTSWSCARRGAAPQAVGAVVAGSHRARRWRCGTAGVGRSTGSGLRSGSPGQVKIVRPDGSPVGTVDRSRAGEVVHEGAVYLHAGRHHRVVELDLDAGRAVVEPDDGDTYTTADDPDGPAHPRRGPIGRAADRCASRSDRSWSRPGSPAIVRKDSSTHDVIERCGLDLPPVELETRGVWRVIPDEVLAGVGLVPESWPGVLHAAEHAAIGVLPLFAICDRWDVGGVSTARHRRHRRADHRHLRRLPGRGGHRRARLRRGGPALAGHRPKWSGRVRAGTVARRASSRPSAATATSRWTRRGRWCCSTRSPVRAATAGRPRPDRFSSDQNCLANRLR